MSMDNKKSKGPVVETELVEGTSLWKDAGNRLRKNRAAMAGLLIVGFMAVMALSYEVVAKYVTGFTMEEQHPYVVPKPPGARSVPAQYYSVLPAKGALSFEAVDTNSDGVIDSGEILKAYRQMEFSLIDKNGDGVLDYDEYAA